jgi:hypothetical protein
MHKKAVVFLHEVVDHLSELECHSETAGPPYIRLRSSKKQIRYTNIATTNN